MRFYLAILLVTAALSGCTSDDTQSTQSVAPELGALGVTNITAEAAAWAYAVVPATDSGDVAGLTFTLTAEALAAAEAQGNGLFLQVIPLLPPGVSIEKYAVLVFDTGYAVSAEAATVAAQAQATVDSARAQAEASGAQATLIAAELFTALEGTAQGATASAAAATEVGAGPVAIPLPADAAVGDVFGIVVGIQTLVDVDAATAVAGSVDLAGKAAIVTSLAGKAQSTLPSATDGLAQVQALAAEGQGIAMPVLGIAQGFAIPAFLLEVDGRAAERVLLASSDIQASVEAAGSSLWPLLSTETISLDVVSEAAAGFGSHLGGVTGDFGRLQYELAADVHGQAASLSDSGLNAATAASASASYALAASGVGGTDLAFEVTSQGHDLAGALWAIGVEFGGPLEVLLGQGGLPVNDLASSGLPIGTASGITVQGPLGVWTLHR